MIVDVQKILKEAVEQNASDIFFVAGSPYAFKIQKEVIKQGTQRLMPDDMKDIIQQLYALAPYCQYENFAKNGDDDYSFSLPSVGRFRVNVYRQRNSEAAVLRVVKFELPDPKKLLIPDAILDLSEQTKGMILVSGPAGSGKSTTLACIIDRINESRSAHIITIEDPIEYLHSHKKAIVSQREVYHDTKDYLMALRAALRETPEVILLGEMRDEETISTAITAAETGHLLLSTLHTVGAVNTIDRILDTFGTNPTQIRAQLSMVLNTVISEQLVPALDGSVIPVFEIMKMTPAIRSQIREGKTHQIENTMTSSKALGMITMDDALYDLYKKNRISAQTAILYSLHPDTMKMRVR